MKSLNLFVLTKEITEQISEYKNLIKNMPTYEDARKYAFLAIGCVNGLILVSSTLICRENNDITAQLDSLENMFMAEIYQAMADKAKETKQSDDIYFKLLTKRDEYREASNY